MLIGYYARLLAPFILSPVENHRKEANNYEGRISEQEGFGQRQGVFIGVDVHKESWHVAARTEGEEVFHGGIPSQYHALRKLMGHFKDCQD